MNCNLDGICQDLNMLRRFDGPDTRQRIARHQAQLDAIKRTGQRQGWAFTAQKRARSAYLGDEPPRTMTLIDQCASRTQGLGAVSYQMLSSVAHARLHGLSHLLAGTPRRSIQPLTAWTPSGDGSPMSPSWDQDSDNRSHHGLAPASPGMGSARHSGGAERRLCAMDRW
jgi:hypothetical protein